MFGNYYRFNLYAYGQHFLSACNDTSCSIDKWLSRVENSSWLSHVKDTLNCACLVAQCLDQECASVLLHGSEGLDSTLLVTSLAQVILNPDCRTVRGYLPAQFLLLWGVLIFYRADWRLWLNESGCRQDIRSHCATRRVASTSATAWFPAATRALLRDSRRPLSCSFWTAFSRSTRNFLALLNSTRIFWFCYLSIRIARNSVKFGSCLRIKK